MTATRITRRVIGAGALGLATLALTEAAALGAAGDLDPSFGTAGIAVHGKIPDATVETLVQPDGKIVRVDVEQSGDGKQLDLRIRRFNADGSPDGTFGDAGLAVADFGGNDRAAGAVLQPDGKLVVPGGHRSTLSSTARRSWPASTSPASSIRRSRPAAATATAS
jgi:hypothetical protein